MHRLARWLRVIGIDAAHSPSQTHQSILKLAATEGRVLLTRDRKLASRRECGACYFVGSNTTDLQVNLTCLSFSSTLLDFSRLMGYCGCFQFQEVVAHFGLEFSNERFMSRCAVCNAGGFSQPSDESSVILLPPPPP